MNDFKNVFIHDSSYIDEEVSIGEGTKIWHFSHILSNSKIGNNCSLGQNVVVGPNVNIGNNVKIQNNVSVYDGVAIEDDVFCGPSCVFTNVINPRSFIERKKEFKLTKVCKGASIGANSTIICGIIINKYSFIGAGSVVTKNVKKFEKIYGNPAVHKGWVTIEGNSIIFNENKEYICPKTNKKYFFDKKNNEIKLEKHE